MQLSTTLLLTPFLALLPYALASSQSNDEHSGNFFNDCTQTGCRWITTTGAQTIECSCNIQPTGPSNAKPPILSAKFYNQDSYTGFLYKAYINPSYPYPDPYPSFTNCYRMPFFWYAQGGSMSVNTTTTKACYVYTAPDCKGDRTEVRSDVQEFLGLYHDGVRSFQCFGY
ncbi:hypothetical protein HYALB_00003901 [Hymenoscyphus albidus]|uniref:Uncharacterized protein n=1 Tax=Hymenoscyphus albidus TaxID=595503 RepID=A0A9N9LQW5_9HELO|nr:hypothetical protein HYALB_00003901 [Hymenoscyphus albidus]